MNTWTLRRVVLCGWLLAGASLHAHHSLAGAYALGKEAKVTGSFTAFRFVNPHSSLKLDVRNPDGSTTEWVFTTGSATTLAERGIGKSSNVLKPGDTITAKFIPARNGNPLGFLKSVTLSDGRVIMISAGNPND